MFTVDEDGMVPELGVHIDDCKLDDYDDMGYNSAGVHIDDVDALRHAGHI